jgi:hypothetical protein
MEEIRNSDEQRDRCILTSWKYCWIRDNIIKLRYSDDGGETDEDEDKAYDQHHASTDGDGWRVVRKYPLTAKGTDAALMYWLSTTSHNHKGPSISPGKGSYSDRE